MADSASASASAGAAAPAAAPAAAAPKAASSSKSKRSALNDTAVHVLKGALVKVLGPSLALTHGIDFAHALKGTLTASYGGGATLTQEQLAAVEQSCNEIIAANLPVQALTLERSKAEATYGSAPVNSQPLYDKDATPAADVTSLSLVQIPGVCLVCCAGPHTASTGELGRLKLVKMRNRHKDGAYEFQFVVGAAADELEQKSAAALAAQNSKKTQAQQQAAVDKNKSNSGAAAATPAASGAKAAAAASASPASASKDYVVETTQAIFNELVLPAFAKLRAAPAAGSDSTPAAAAASASSSSGASDLPASDVASLKKTLLPSLEQYLIMFANEAYTRGWKAHSIGSGNTPLARLL